MRLTTIKLVVERLNLFIDRKVMPSRSVVWGTERMDGWRERNGGRIGGTAGEN